LCIVFSTCYFSNISSTDLVQLSVNYFALHYLLVNPWIWYIDKLTLIWVSTAYCKLSEGFRHVFHLPIIPQSHVGLVYAHCAVINDNALIVFKYRHKLQYLKSV